MGQGRITPAVRPDRPMASDGAGRNPQRLRPAPPTHAPVERPRDALRAEAWTCGTRRHRVTEERYARRISAASNRSGPRPAPAALSRPRVWISPRHTTPPPAVPQAVRQPVDSALPEPSARGYVRTLVEFPRVRLDPFPAGAPAPGRQKARSGPLTCGDPVLAGPRVNVSAGRFHKETATFTRCGQTCGTTRLLGSAVTGRRDHRHTHDEESGTTLWTTTPTSRPPGSASSRSCSPTNRPGSRPANRSRCTETPRSSPSPTTSPAPSSRAGSVASSRTR